MSQAHPIPLPILEDLRPYQVWEIKWVSHPDKRDLVGLLNTFLLVIIGDKNLFAYFFYIIKRFLFISFLIMVAFSIGNFHIYWYGIFYVVGFLITYFFLKWVGKKRFFVKQKNVQDILEHSLEDLLIYLILGVLIGGRLGEVFIYQWPYFSQHLLEIFAVWHGGMSFVGGITGVLLAVLIFIKVKKLTFSDFVILLSLLCVVAPFAIMLGRFGNYLNQELYGIMIPQLFLESHESLSAFLAKINIFHTYDLVDQNLRLNTNFLAIIFEGLIPFIIGLVLFTVQLKRKKFKPFLNMGIFLILYSTARFVLEYFRVESQTQLIGGFTKSQRIFIVAFIIGIFMLCLHKKKIVEL